MVLVFHFNRQLLQSKLHLFLLVVLVVTGFSLKNLLASSRDNCDNSEPVDVVYTWVNGSDPKFLSDLKSYLTRHGNEGDASMQRYSDNNELRYSLRSLERFAPWVNHVYLVTNGQVPSWLDLECGKVTVVTHEEVFEDDFYLPTFSSPAIELQLHRIPGLNKRFIYFNDDVFLRAPVFKEDFYAPNRGYLIYLAWIMPECAPECSWLYVADATCDDVCNNPNCQMDGGDCSNEQPLIGDSIVKFDDYDSKNVNVSIFKNNFELKNISQVGRLIERHNRAVLMRDKMKRRKVRRKPMDDAYSGSLQHTNRVLNNKFGFSLRKVPAHAPIMIHKDIMEEMQVLFGKEVGITIRNRVRSIDDLQFSFAYYYHLVHLKENLTLEGIFDEFDVDSSGTWSENEIRSIIAKQYDLPLKEEDFLHFQSLLYNCTKNLHQTAITKEIIANCPVMREIFKSMLSRHKYRYEIVKDSEKNLVAFKMLTSNVRQVIFQLDEIRKNEKKFVCLNDNMDPARAFDNAMVARLMKNFYLSMFPNRSGFELPENQKNRFAYYEEYLQFVRNRKRKLILAYVFLGLSLAGVAMNVCRKKICNIFVRLCY